MKMDDGLKNINLNTMFIWSIPYIHRYFENICKDCELKVESC